MAVAFRSASIGATLATALPTGNAQDDWIGAILYGEGNEPSTPTTATGWTYWDGYTALTGADNGWCHFYYIIRGASAPATNWSNAASYKEANYVCYSGVDTTTPINTYAKQQCTDLVATTVTWPTITSSVNGCMIVGLCAIGHFSACTTANWANERADASTTSAAHFHDDGLKATAGAVTAKTETGGVGWQTIMAALQPAGGGAAVAYDPAAQIVGQASAIQRSSQW